MGVQLEQAISEILDSKLGYQPQKDGTFVYEIYADYRDQMDAGTAIGILQAKEPMEVFWETLDEWYRDYRWALEDELEKELWAKLTNDSGPYPDGLPDEAEFRDLLTELVYYSLPEKHFLKQTFRTNIMVDTGDGNFDYTLNTAYPCWYGVHGAPIDDRAGIVWLAKSQGCTKARLQKALWAETAPDGFLASMRAELVDLCSHMSTVTFLVELTLEQLIELNSLIQLQNRDGRHYDARDNPYCGYIILDKGTMTGLYDPWSGGGSMFDIQLEKDVRLPVKYIRSALPDGGDGYAIEGVYSMCGSAWQRGGVKIIHAPKKIPA